MLREELEARGIFSDIRYGTMAAGRSRIVLTAARPIGVVLAEVQEEILWACEAAHMPVVWATQVLENLAKTGRPSRAEITDAAMGERAECVMLNKGPAVAEAVSLLDHLLSRMDGHMMKKTPMLRALKSWPGLRVISRRMT